MILVEGYFDCMRVHQAGFPWVAALMGSCLSMEQERLLLANFETVVLMLDGDAAGRAASQTITARLSETCSVVIVRLPDGAQPDRMSDGAIRRLLTASE